MFAGAKTCYAPYEKIRPSIIWLRLDIPFTPLAKIN
jgi:hypothetical protein